MAAHAVFVGRRRRIDAIVARLLTPRQRTSQARFAGDARRDDRPVRERVRRPVVEDGSRCRAYFGRKALV
jgi:hypothetical protein